MYTYNNVCMYIYTGIYIYTHINTYTDYVGKQGKEGRFPDQDLQHELATTVHKNQQKTND